MNKKGISEVVGTILIVLLAIAAVVIIWAVLKPALEKTAGGISTNCLEVDLEVTSADCTGSPDVIVKLNSGTISGVKLIFSNGTDSDVIDETDFPEELGTKAYNDLNVTLTNPNSVNVGAVIKTEAGETKTCQPTATAKSC